jgi:hypothetical protein
MPQSVTSVRDHKTRYSEFIRQLEALLTYFSNCTRRVAQTSGHGLHDGRVGVRVPVGSRIFTSPCRPDRLLGLPSLLCKGTGDFFPRMKRYGREADHLSPTSAEVKTMRIYTSTPIRLHGVVLNQLSTGTTVPFTFFVSLFCGN